MPFLLEFILLFTLGLFVPILLFRLFLQKYAGRDDSTLDRTEGYGRGWGDAHWRKLNERQPGEAEKRKSQHEFEGARLRSSPTPLHIAEPSRLAVPDDKSEPVPLSDLLPDEQAYQKKKRR